MTKKRTTRVAVRRVSPKRASAKGAPVTPKRSKPRQSLRRAAAPLAGSPAAQAQEIEFLVRRRIEDLAQGFVSLASELWIVKDRIATLEQVLEEHGIPASRANNYEPAGEFKARLDAARREFARRTVAALFPRGLPKVD